MKTAREAEWRGYCDYWGLQDYTLQGGAGSRLQRVKERIGGKEAEEAGVEWRQEENGTET